MQRNKNAERVKTVMGICPNQSKENTDLIHDFGHAIKRVLKKKRVKRIKKT
jgi:hypothetical protein